MQPEEIYFRGSISRYWKVIYAQYRRLYKRMGREPFRLTAPNPASVILAEYDPDNSHEILFELFGDERGKPAFSIDAEYSRHRQAVWIMVHDHGAQGEKAGSALLIWQKIKRALKNDEAARKQTRKRGMQSRTQIAINSLLEIRQEAITSGRPIPKKIGAMQRAGITYKTTRNYVPELLAHWDDRNYRPGKLE
ncbi:MAG: hypothetical protein ACOYZ8_10685 [Chloroflexota bacterium]